MSQDQHERFATTPSSFAADLRSYGKRIIVTARGQLELSSQPILAAAIAKVIAVGGSEVVIDLEGLDSIDPEDVGLLVRARSLLRSRGQHLVVRSPCSNAVVLAACALLDPFASVGHVVEQGSFPSAIA